MYELTGKIQNLALDFATRKATLTLSINEEQAAKNMYDDLHECEKLSIKIDKYREKRSLNANNYAWALMNEIGNVTRMSKDDVYLKMLKRYGQSEKFSALADVPFGAFVKYYDEIGESSLNGKLFKHYRAYKGSSEFDTREMSIFLDGVISEAEELGIQTMTPNEIAKLKSLWGE